MACSPMTIMSASDALPRAAAVVLGQYLWRYRSELYPPALAALAEVASLAAAREEPACLASCRMPGGSGGDRNCPCRPQAWAGGIR